MDSEPSCLDSSNWDTIKSLSDLAKAILASKSRLLDWINSSVVLVLPESYSKVIPSFAISAAFNCALVASSTLLEDWYFDQALEISVLILFFVSCNINWYLCLLYEDFFIEEIFSPPLIIGHVIVALTVSWSVLSIVELKSSFSDFEKFNDADGENLDLSIFKSLTAIS